MLFERVYNFNCNLVMIFKKRNLIQTKVNYYLGIEINKT